MNFWTILVVQVVFFLQSPIDNEALMPDRLSNKLRNHRANMHRERIKFLNRQKRLQNNQNREYKTVDFVLKDSPKDSEYNKQHKPNLKKVNFNPDSDTLPTVKDIKVADAVVLNKRNLNRESTLKERLVQELIRNNDGSKEEIYQSELPNINDSGETKIEKPISDPKILEKPHRELSGVKTKDDVQDNVVTEGESSSFIESGDQVQKEDLPQPTHANGKDVVADKDGEDERADVDEAPIQPTLEPNVFDQLPGTETPAATASIKAKTSDKRDEVADDDLQSFEEWKKKQIQSKENAASSENQGAPPRTVRTKKTQMNYASQDCGAKVLSHNSEAKNVGAILDENKDLYMLNPCSNQIWFVIELCEPIQVEQVQLANLELFSSMPHLFNLYVSERFPAREWRSLGTFEARNERAVQTFVSKPEEAMFAKYLKFEMKSHFGNEHFCPLTLIRVLGVSMVEEYESQEEEKSLKQHQASDGAEKAIGKVDLSNTDEIEKSDELAVSEDAPAREESGSIGKVLDMVKSAVDNLLGNGKPHDNATLSANGSDISAMQNDSQEESIDSEWESPVTLVTNKTEIDESVRNRPTITIIETGDGQEVEVVLYAPPLYPLDFLRRISSKTFGTKLCWFLEFMYRVSLLSCVVPSSNRTSTSDAFPYLKANISKTDIGKEKTVQTELNRQNESDFGLVDMAKSKTNSAQLNDVKAVSDTNTVSSLPVPDTPNSTESDQKINVVVDESNESKTVNRSDKTNNYTFTSQTDSGDNNTAPEPESSLETDEKTKSKQVCDKSEVVVARPAVEVEDRPSESTEMKPDISVDKSKDEEPRSESESSNETKVESVSTEKANENEKDAKVNKSEPSAVDEDAPTPEVPTPSSVESSITPTSEEISTENFLTPIPPVLKQKENVSEDTVVINPGTNQKESVLMRLSNRIRTLEQNLSLSSAYLENLSRRYRRQMDEMQRAFNLTQNRLKEMTHVMEANDRKHDDELLLRSEEINRLQVNLEVLEESNEQLNRFMIARHFCLMAIESVVLIVICMTCFGARQLRMMRKVEKSEALFRSFQNLSQPKLMNGHAKLASSSSLNTGRRHLTSRDRAQDMVVVSSRSKSKSSLDMEQLASLFASSSTSSLSSTSVQRKKSLKTLNSPIKKRKNSHSSGKMIKPSAKLSAVSLASASGRWTTAVPKEQSVAKSKKHAFSKKEPKKSAQKSRGSVPTDAVYSSRDKSVFPSSTCYTATSFWDKYTSFSSLVGKAR